MLITFSYLDNPDKLIDNDSYLETNYQGLTVTLSQ